MAKNKKSTILLLQRSLMLSLLLVLMSGTTTEGSKLFEFGFDAMEEEVPLIPAGPKCESVYGVVSGDTCSAIRKEFNLSSMKFCSINPNLVCDKLFVGQWLCVKGELA